MALYKAPKTSVTKTSLPIQKLHLPTYKTNNKAL